MSGPLPRMSGPLPRAMACVEIAAPGGPEVLRLAERALPEPAPGEVLIAVAAAGVNHADLLQRRGRYPPPPGASDVPGLEVAGTVARLGQGIDGLRVGDSVCALLAGGGYADYCAVPAGQVLPVPEGLDTIAAAALPEAVFTVWTNLIDRARLAAGERLLVHGGTSGIGVTAIQLARALGARVFATAGTAEKCAVCERLGAERAIDYRKADFVAEIAASTGEVDVILDMVGGDYLARNLELLATEGRLVQIAFMAGAKVEVDLMAVMRKRLTITGSTLRARPVEDKAAIARAVRARVWPLIEAGAIVPVIDSVFPLAEAAQAHRRMEAGGHVGKIVLRV